VAQFVKEILEKLDSEGCHRYLTAAPQRLGLPMGSWRLRLLDSTRGRVVALLRRSAQTVSDLAEKLDLTSNAVRLHLSALERDGLVEPHGTRREWTGKPATLYRTTGDAEALFPKPYHVVLSEVLAALETSRPPKEVRAIMRGIGARLATQHAPPAGDVRARAEHAAAVLNGMGGIAEVVEEEGGLRLQGYGCPLGEVTVEHPVTCQLAESLVSELVGVPATECCDRSGRPRCAFRIAV
jgi:predicted ArsR family transcriptional regulator